MMVPQDLRSVFQFFVNREQVRDPLETPKAFPSIGGTALGTFDGSEGDEFAVGFFSALGLEDDGVLVGVTAAVEVGTVLVVELVSLDIRANPPTMRAAVPIWNRLL
jgi:hypothetical protein